MKHRLPVPLKYAQSGLFVAAGILLGLDLLTSEPELHLPQKGRLRTITFVLLAVTALYPVIGLLRGHSRSQLIYPGTLPCGSTAFALVILSASLPRVNKPVYILLLLWAIPFAPLIQIPVFKVYEDSIMVIIGLYALIRLITAWHSQKRTAKEGTIKQL